MTDKVAAFIRREALIQRGQTVGCAVSGGADSVALFLCLQTLASVIGFTVYGIHYEHGIRGSVSEADAEFVKDLCTRSGIPLFTRSGDVPAMAREQHIGLELAARQARAAYFAELADAGVVDVIATAHHLDDNAETLLLHLARGSGLDGLAGIRPKRDYLIRPLLCVHRSEILQFLSKQHQSWREDSTNGDIRLARNYVRHNLLPALRHLNPQVTDALKRLSDAASSDADYLDMQSAEELRRIVTYNAAGAALDLAAFQVLHPALAVRVIRRALAQIGRPLDVEYSHLEAVRSLAAAGKTGSALDLGAGFTAAVSYGSLLLRRPGQEADRYEVRFVREGATRFPGGTLRGCRVNACAAGRPDAEYINAACLTAQTVVRTRRPGDIFHPLGASGRKKLKDYFIDKKVPRSERGSVPLLADGPRILWVIGRCLSQEAAVRPDTAAVLLLTYTPEAAHT